MCYVYVRVSVCCAYAFLCTGCSFNIVFFEDLKYFSERRTSPLGRKMAGRSPTELTEIRKIKIFKRLSFEIAVVVEDVERISLDIRL